MKCPKCKAKFRTNYPFGRKSKPRTSGVHEPWCKYKTKQKKKRRDDLL